MTPEIEAAILVLTGLTIHDIQSKTLELLKNGHHPTEIVLPMIEVRTSAGCLRFVFDNVKETEVR